MASIYDPYGRGRRIRPSVPTFDDYQTLAQAFQTLQAQAEQTGARLQEADRQLGEAAKRMAQLEQELEIKNEALHRQGAALKETESELIWTRAALQQVRTENDTAEHETWKIRFQRLQAELDSLRKRLEQRFETELTNARHQILLDMLPLADHLDLAMQHAPGLKDDAARSFVDSIKATRQAFQETLTRYGVAPIEADTALFDPTQHEAMGRIATSDVPADHVAQVVQTGYTESGRLLRPARVLISAGPAEE